jgi:hypothetical protein
MTRPKSRIVADIDAFETIDGNWLALDGLLEELWRSGDAESHIPRLFAVLERFPE